MLENISDKAVKDIIDSCQAQDAVLQDMNRLNEALLASSEAKVRDMTLQKQRIEEQIQAVQADLDFLAPLVAGTLAAAGAEGAAETDAALLTSSDEAQDENFMDVIIKSDESGSFSSNSSSSSSTQSSWNLGGWFNPTIFKLSDNYYRLADIRVSKGLTKTDIHKASAESSRQYMEQSDARGGASSASAPTPAAPARARANPPILAAPPTISISASPARRSWAGSWSSPRRTTPPPIKNWTPVCIPTRWTPCSRNRRKAGSRRAAERPEPSVSLSHEMMEDRLRSALQARLRRSSLYALLQCRPACGPSVRSLSCGRHARLNGFPAKFIVVGDQNDEKLDNQSCAVDGMGRRHAEGIEPRTGSRPLPHFPLAYRFPPLVGGEPVVRAADGVFPPGPQRRGHSADGPGLSPGAVTGAAG